MGGSQPLFTTADTYAHVLRKQDRLTQSIDSALLEPIG